jgi:tetratricopeptide (TPR) repeat protein
MAELKLIRGDNLSAEEDIEQAMRQDPLNNLVNRRYVGTLARKGRLDEALAKGKFLANAMPETGGVHYGVSNVLMSLGNFEEALVWAKKDNFDHLRLKNEAIIYHELGDQETAQQKLQEMIDTWGDDVSWQVAEIYTAWGNVDETFAALERGFRVRDPGIVYILSDTEMVALLEDDPRYDPFLRKLNLF